MTLRLGVARADITPATGIPMVGFAGRGPASAVHDALHATALAAEEGDCRALLISLDLLQLQASTVAACRARIAQVGVAADHIALACTHNHYGPSVDRDEGDIVDAYREHLGHLLAGVAQQACARLQPVRLGLAWGASDIGINRRERHPDGRIVLGHNPGGPIDRQVGVARIETDDGRPLASLLSFACHPVSQGGQMAALSADFPGRACRLVEELTGAPCLYLQGACGDVNPIRMEHAYEPARSLGVRLGCEAARLWETIAPEPAAGLEVTSQTVDLPGYRFDSEANATRLVAQLEAEIEARRDSGDTSGGLWWAQHRLEKVRRALDSWRSGTALEPVTAELQAWRLGPLAMTSAPGEIFAENGQHVKSGSPFEHTFFLGYTNGSIGYVPTRNAYPEGGYEVTHACRVDPDAGDQINEGCLALLGSLAG